MSFIVKWGRERLHFPLPPPTTPLGVIRKDLENYTHLTPGTYKLIHAGAVMKDDNVPSTWHLRFTPHTLILDRSTTIRYQKRIYHRNTG